MLSPLVSWILSSSTSSSSSSSTEEEEEGDDEQSLDIDNNTDESDHENDNVSDHKNDKVVDRNQDNNDQNDTPNSNDENDHYLSSRDDADDTIPVALAVPEASPVVTVAFPAAADERTTVAATTIVSRPKRQRAANYSGIVRQYHRLWTKQDEIKLLKGYLDYVKQKQGATNSLQNDVALFYDDVRHKLDAEFNTNQLVEKLRRLKRKHKVALDKGGKEVSFKNPHDEAIFEISQKIWGNDTGHDDALDVGVGGDDLGEVKVKAEQNGNCDVMENQAAKRLRLVEHGEGDIAAADVYGFIEETMRSCFSPMTMELLDGAGKGPPGGLAPKPAELCPGEVGGEKWRKQRISKLEVYSDRLELLQDQVKAKLEELRSGRG